MSLKCPICGNTLDRVHCNTADRFIGLFVPVRRYRCRNITCKWEMRQINGSAKKTTSIKDVRFKLAILIIASAAGLVTLLGAWLFKNPSPQSESSSLDFSTSTTGVLHNVEKLEKLKKNH